MWLRCGHVKALNGPLSVGLGLATATISLIALGWLLSTGGRPLHQAVAKARLQWYTPHAISVTQPSDLHGRVHKAGPIDLKRFYPQLRESCDADRLRWTAAAGRDNLTEGELSSLQQIPCFDCQVFVNHMYKVIYLRQPKVASSSTLEYFGLCSPERSEETGCLRAWYLTTPIPSAKEVAARATYLPLANISKAQVADLWDDYFVFTVVRNPFSRAMSQYRTGMLSNLVEPAECATLAEELNWDSVCDSPLVMLTFCARHPECCIHGAVPGVAIKLIHLAPLAPCMTTPEGRLAADFVLRQELMEEDMAELLQHLNARQGVPKLTLGPMRVTANVYSLQQCKSQSAPRHLVKEVTVNQCPNQVGHECLATWQGLDAREQYCSAQEFYSGRHTHCKAGIAAFYADDLRLLYGGGLHQS